MDATEQLVEAYLRRAGFTDIVYEPDGNIPPDFPVNNRIAIEARRLNQNYDAGTGRGARGLEEDAIPLWHQMTSYLTALGPPGPSETSWYVLYRFGRPVIWKDIKRELDRVLKPFLNCPDPQAFNKVLSDRFSIRVFKSPFPKDTCFRAAGHSDEQSGGWLMSMMDENLHHCVLEKSRKIARHRAKYSEWWLIMPDHIGYTLDELERDLFLEQVAVPHGAFNRIILLDPRDVSRSIDIAAG